MKRTLTMAKGGPMLSTPKAKGSRRSVRLTQSAVEALGSHLERQLGEIINRDIGQQAPCGRRTALYSLLRWVNPWNAAI